ncbi:DeoR/GlpR family DNA-binding transcription regulator [Aureimonas populi]|uniref:DeoR/GlpR family DNA-binding transcription regulator n=1 Tax=Aureimonas populi TaxID=1701758 RepID=A0ABW5CN70_9HYPH|nr:DeoR/GlpR family DNA-binding transcription regulator [Aureimonas populi]
MPRRESAAIFPGDMIPDERQQHLLQWFDTNIGGSNQELARIFNTSVSTIRRDLDALAARGLVRRTHGGAVGLRRRTTAEPSAQAASMTAVEEKQAIAREAAKRLEPEQSILLDTGSTIVHLAHAIADLAVPLTVVTNDIQIAGILAGRSHIKLVMPGGTCRYRAYSLMGEPGLSFLRQIRCDRFFLSAQALDGECASETSLELVNLKRAMLAAARASTLLIDSSRIPARAIYRLAPLDELNEIITDDGFPEAEAATFRDQGIAFTRAQVAD